MKFKKMITIPALLLSVGVLTYCASAKSYDTVSETGPDIIPNYSGSNSTISGYCQLTFDANGSTFKGTTVSSKSFQVRKGLNWARIKDNPAIPADETDLNEPPEGYDRFLAWLTPTSNYIYDEYVFEDENVTLTAKWGEDFHPIEFASDSWDQVIQVAEQGYQALADYYADDFTQFGNSSFIINDLNNPDEVAAKTRYVHIDGKVDLATVEDEKVPLDHRGDWPVRVIGEKHDLIKGSLKNQVAPLTFEFVHSINDAISWDLSKDPGHTNWNNSTIRDYLNTYVYYQIEDQLASGIQTVLKQTDNGDYQDKVESSSDQLFLPSFNEVVADNHSQVYSKYENSTYGYYVLHHESKDLVKTNPYNDNEPIATWLRSPNLDGSETSILTSNIALITPETNSYTNEITATINPAYANKAYGVCPCFSIGTSSALDIEFNGTGLELTPVDNYAIKDKGLTVRLKAIDAASPYDAPLTTEGQISLKKYDGTTRVLDEGEDGDYSYDYATGIIKFKDDTFEGYDSGSLVFNINAEINKFKAASWDELISIANEGGIFGLKDAYFDGDREKSFVGMEKYITIGSANYRTRVIGESHDIVENDAGIAPLTFEFVDALEDSHIWDDGTVYDYPESALNTYLASVVSQNEIMQKFQSVKKPVSTQEGSYVAKLFPLSLVEYGKDDSAFEGETYEYYLPTNAARDKYLRYHEGELVDYWTRTPYHQTMEPSAYYINKNGLPVSEAVNRLHYVAPAFAIGFNNVDTTIKFTGTNYTVDEAAPENVVIETESGKTKQINGIKATTQAGVVTTIIESNITITTGNGEIFTDWELVNLGNNEYGINLNNIPISGLVINIVPTNTTAYFAATLKDEFPTDVWFDEELPSQGTEPITESYLSYTREINPDAHSTNWEDYHYGDHISLTPDNPTVYFKARGKDDDGNPFENKTFTATEQTSFDPEYCYGTLFKTYRQDHIRPKEAKVAISGNIMTLLGNGSMVPSTISDNAAFAWMFSNKEEMNHIVQEGVNPPGVGDFGEVYDASGLTLLANGVDPIYDTSDTEVNGTYAYMFYLNSSLLYGPASIAGFNHYEHAKVSNTYAYMFAGEKVLNPQPTKEIWMNLKTMPKCDFTRACDGMCERMFARCEDLLSANNTLTDEFIVDYAEHAFDSMFYQCTSLMEGPAQIGRKAEMGESSIVAKRATCSSMFQGCLSLLKTPRVVCNIVDESAFYEMFADCPALKTAYLDFDSLKPDLQAYAFYYLYGRLEQYGAIYSLKDIYLYSAKLNPWPRDQFPEWILDQNTEGATLHCEYETYLGLSEWEPSASTLPENWSVELL